MIFEDVRQVEGFIYGSYLKAVKYIDTKLPDSETRSPELTKQLLNMVQNPDTKQRNVLVTGSKGKGSVSRMVSKLLETHGYRVGLFTSPHLINFNERIRINGIAISDENLIRYAEKIRPYVDEIENTLPTNKYIGPVGITSVIAMMYFYDNRTDFNIVECGKGAKFDDVCMIESEISVINSIFLEHVPQLGKNNIEIAHNKAGVFKISQKVGFLGEQSKEICNVFIKEANNLMIELKIYGYNYISKNIKITSKGTTFDLINDNDEYRELRLSLLGSHQAKNAALAVGVVKGLIGELDESKVRESFKNIAWPGRLEIVNQNPVTILDGCINRKSTSYVKEIVNQLKKDRIVFIIGIPDEKDFEGVLDEFKEDAYKIIMTTTKHQHDKFSNQQLVVAVEMLNEKFLYEDTLDSAIKRAFELLQEEDLLVILGTQSLVRETKVFFGQDTTFLEA